MPLRGSVRAVGDVHVSGLSLGPGVYTQHFNPGSGDWSRSGLLSGAQEAGVGGRGSRE